MQLKALAVERLVVALNWLTLGQTMHPPDRARRGFPMSQQQFEMLEHLDSLVDYFLRAGEVTAESLGRAGEKLAKLAKYAFNWKHQATQVDFEDVDRFLQVLHKTFDGYTNPRTRTRQCSPESGPRFSEGDCDEAALKPVVRMPMQTCSNIPVRASRVKWKLEPSFDPTPFLTDPVVKAAFIQPDTLRRPKQQWPSLPKARVHASRSDVLELAEKWDALNACCVVPCSEVREIETVGMFCVPKDSEWDRLILNPTVIKSRCFGYSAYTKTEDPSSWVFDCIYPTAKR